MSHAKNTDFLHHRRPGIPICRIKYEINQFLVKAAKRRNAKAGKKIRKRSKPVRSPEPHWNTNMLHGRMTRSWTRIFDGGAPVYTLRLRYLCMPLLGDESVLVPTWEVHVLSLAVEFARLASRPRQH